MNPIIKIENLNLWYEKGKPIEVHALKNISIGIEKGDYAAFFGPSGCGKTSILYAISGIDKFQDGKVIINDLDISTLDNKDLSSLRQTGIGIVFQQFNLVPSLNVVKNVALPMLFVGVDSKKAEEEALRIINRLGLSSYAHRYPHELSGGQQQRVGIARALANNPPIIIADEPLGNLDSTNAKIVLEFLKELNEKDGRTIIMVTHEAWSLRDVKTIFHMKDGVVGEVEKTTDGSIASSISRHLNEQLSAVSTFSDVDNSKERVFTRILANFLLRGYSMDEIKRFEVFVDDLFDNKIDSNKFHQALSKSYKDGGVGLRKKKATNISKYVEEIIEKRKEVESISKMLHEDIRVSIIDKVSDIRDWLIVGYNGKMVQSQLEALSQVISDRIRGFIKPSEAAEVLDLSLNRYGAGLSFRASQLITEKLELILSNTNSELEIQNEQKEN